MKTALIFVILLITCSHALRTTTTEHEYNGPREHTFAPPEFHEQSNGPREHLLTQLHDKQYADNYQGEPICRNYAGHTGTGWCARYCNNYGYAAYSYWCWTGAQEDGGYVGCYSDYQCHDKRICVGRCSWA